MDKICAALDATPPDEVKTVIIGEEPRDILPKQGAAAVAVDELLTSDAASSAASGCSAAAVP